MVVMIRLPQKRRKFIVVNNLLLLSGNDIPFPEARLVIHQPRIQEIAYVGEEKFFMGCEMLNFSKEILNDKDKVGLENISDFILLSYAIATL